VSELASEQLSAQRREELAAGLDRVRARIASASHDAGRDPADVTLVVVTKTFPASDVAILAELGVRDVGESRHPEARDKYDAAPAGLVWHFVGAVQRNKTRAIAAYADVVHSVDRARLVDPLSRGAADAGRVVRCLVQVNLDPVESGDRAGCAPTDVGELADLVAAADHLQLGGVMTIAPLGLDPAPTFDRLAEIAGQLRAAYADAGMVSAGMSGDLEAAIAAGATHVRVGRAVLGERPSDG
jgi:pyridoxal phosphate enzyme (YggS family)